MGNGIRLKRKSQRRAVVIAGGVIALALVAAVVFIAVRIASRRPTVDKSLTGGVWSTAGYENISDVKSYHELLLVFTDAQTGKVGLMTLDGTVTEPAEHEAFQLCSDVWRSYRYTVKSPRSEYTLLADPSTGTVTNKQYHGLTAPAQVPCWSTETNRLVWISDTQAPAEVKSGELALRQGLYPVADGTGETARWGYIDSAQQLAIGLSFEKALDFSGGIAAAKKDGKWGYINEDGVAVIPFAFDSVGSCAVSEHDTAFSMQNGLIPVCKDGKFGIINAKGLMVIPFEFEAMVPGANGVYIARRNGVWGTVTVDAETLAEESTALPPTTETIELASGSYVVKTAGSVLNMRTEPNAEAAIAAKIPNGSAVTVIRMENGWAYTQYGTLKGWVSAAYLAEAPTTAPPATIPEATTTAAPGVTATPPAMTAPTAPILTMPPTPTTLPRLTAPSATTAA